MNESASNIASLPVVSFMAGGYRFAVEATWVRAQFSATKADEAIHVDKLLGLPGRSDVESYRLLVIRHPVADYPVRVSEPVILSELSLNDIHPLPAMLAARCTINGIRALSCGSEGITVLIDMGAISQCVIGADKKRNYGAES